jgi:hypothetical protein
METKTYVEQESMRLPEIKAEIIPRANTISTTPSIIPNNEIIKQLNLLNNKLDNLTEMMTKLTNNFNESPIISENK